MRRAITTLLTIAALPFAAPAHAGSVDVNGGTISVPATLLADDFCIDVPVTYDLLDIPYDYSWTLKLDSTSTGDIIDLDTGPSYGTTDALWCPADLPGSFHLQGTLEVLDENFETSSFDLISLDFTVKKRATTATIRIPDKTPKVGKVFEVKGCVSAAGKRDPWRDLVLQTRKPGGDWKRLGASSTDEVGCYSEDVYMERAGTRYLRARVPATNSRTSAYSKTITLKAHK